MPAMQPTVTVAGYTLAASWNGTSVAALANLKIQWGREGLYDQPNPSRASLEVIDPDGALVSNPTLYQQPILITRPTTDGTGTVIMFKGRIDEIAIWPAVITDPFNGQRTDVWRARIGATDLLAQLTKTVAPGYGYPVTDAVSTQLNEALSQDYGPNFWLDSGAPTRLTQIEARAAERGIDLHTLPVSTVVNANFRSRIERVGISLFDLLATLYNSAPFGHVRYDPNANTVGPGNFTAAASLALVYTGGILRIVFAAAAAGLSVDANQVIVDDDAEVTSQIAHNLTSFRFSYGYAGAGTKAYQTSATTPSSPDGKFGFSVPQVDQDTEIPIAGTVGGPNQLEVDFPARYRDYPNGATDLRPQQWADVGAPIVRELNGKLYMPACRFDLQRFAYLAALVDVILSPVTPTIPFTFLGAKYASLPGFGPMFQLIGALIAYTGTGWTVDGVFAPARSGTAAPVTYANWVTNTAAEYQDFDTPISYADFANVGTGAA